MAFSLTNLCSMLLIYFRLFKRRFLAVIGHGKPKQSETSLLPLSGSGNHASSTSSSARAGLESRAHSSSFGKDAEMTESWDQWTQDAKQELVSVAVVDQMAVIEERKIENLFASMAPPVLPAAATSTTTATTTATALPPSALTTSVALGAGAGGPAAFPARRVPGQDMFAPTSGRFEAGSGGVSSRFAVSDSFALKGPELDEWVDDADGNAWDQEEMDERDIAAVEKRKLAQERRERRQREQQRQREGTKEPKKLGTRA